MVNIDTIAKFLTFFAYGQNQINCIHVPIKMHPTTDQDMGNKSMLVQNFHEQALVPLKSGNSEILIFTFVSIGALCDMSL